MDICIVGGGIAGLGLAGRLRQQGLDPVVIEQAEGWERAGWGIALWDTGIAVLEELGIEGPVLEDGSPMERFQLQGEDGDTVAGWSLDDTSDRLLAVHRADLHRALRHPIPPDRIRLDTRVEGITEDAAGVTVTFDDGSTERFDLVVGADGVDSTVREQCLSAEATVQDIAIWSLWCDHAPGEQATRIWTSPGRYAFFTEVKGRGLSNITARIPDAGSFDPPARDRLEEIAAGLGRELPELIAAVDDDDLFCDTVRTVDLARWTTDRIVVIGDAAHALNPIVGMGASLALEDAHVLADELTDTGRSLEERLESYAERRRPRIRSVRRLATAAEHLLLSRHPIVPALGKAFLNRASWLIGPGYRWLSGTDLHDL